MIRIESNSLAKNTPFRPAFHFQQASLSSLSNQVITPTKLDGRDAFCAFAALFVKCKLALIDMRVQAEAELTDASNQWRLFSTQFTPHKLETEAHSLICFFEIVN
jgi:hypothetical protein